MTIRIVRLADLTDRERQAWRQLRRAHPRYESVFFTDELAATVDRICNDVEVALIEHDGRPVAFLPFQRRSGVHGHALLACLSDVQGAVSEPAIHWDARQLLRAAGLQVFYFDHLLQDDSPLQRCCWRYDRAWHVDLTAGFQEYARQHKAAGSQVAARCGQRLRKLHREVGPVHFTWHWADAQVVATLVRWKSEQLTRSHLPNVFVEPWTMELLAQLQAARGDACEGVVSTLTAGGRLAAIHFGLRCGRVLTSWIPGYEAALARYSPGMILHWWVLEQASQRGVQRVDLGRGRNQLKLSLANDETRQGLGAVDLHPLRCLARSAWYTARDVAHGGLLGQRPLHAVRRLRTWLRRPGTRRFESVTAVL